MTSVPFPGETAEQRAQDEDHHRTILLWLEAQVCSSTTFKLCARGRGAPAPKRESFFGAPCEVRDAGRERPAYLLNGDCSQRGRQSRYSAAHAGSDGLHDLGRGPYAAGAVAASDFSRSEDHRQSQHHKMAAPEAAGH